MSKVITISNDNLNGIQFKGEVEKQSYHLKQIL